MRGYSSDGDHWISVGRTAANAGKTSEAVGVAVLLFGNILSGIAAIIDNHFDIYNEIQSLKDVTRSIADPGAVPHRRRL